MLKRKSKAFVAGRNLIKSTSRKENCHAKAVAESRFQLIKETRVKQRFMRPERWHRHIFFDHITMQTVLYENLKI